MILLLTLPVEVNFYDVMKRKCKILERRSNLEPAHTFFHKDINLRNDRSTFTTVRTGRRSRADSY